MKTSSTKFQAEGSVRKLCCATEFTGALGHQCRRSKRSNLPPCKQVYAVTLVLVVTEHQLWYDRNGGGNGAESRRLPCQSFCERFVASLNTRL